MINYILNLPTVLLSFIAAIIGGGGSLFLLFLFRKKFKNDLFTDNHEVSSVFFNALGLLYTVLVSFVVIATWTSYSEADLNVEVEANQIHDLFITTGGLPFEYRDEARKLIIEYLNSVVKGDWNYLEKGERNPESSETLIKLWNYYLQIRNIKSSEQQSIYSQSLIRLDEITKSRRFRVQSSEHHIPAILWVVILSGSISTVVFSLFFKGKNVVLQSIVTATFAMINSLIILLILLLDHPFTGDSAITNEPLKDVILFVNDYLSKNP